MSRRVSGRTIVYLFVAPALAIVLIVVALLSRSTQKEWMAQQWRAEIESLSDDQVLPAVERLLVFDEAAISVLVELLTNQRASIVEAARETLLDETSRWASLSKREESRRLARLAEALSQYAEEMGPLARSLAAELATHVLLRPLDGDTVDRVDVLAHCDAVLLVYGSGQKRLASGRDGAAATFDPLEESREAKRRIETRTTAAADVLQASLLPGGSLPVQPHDVPMLPEDKPPVGMELMPQEIGAPRVLLAPNYDTQPIQPAVEPEVVPIPAEQEPIPISSAKSSPIVRQSLEGDPRAGAANRGASYQKPIEIASQPTLAVIRMLHSSDPSLAQLAEQELQRRGMLERGLHFAFRLGDPDPRKRRQLANDLLMVRDFDATGWLFWLSQDHDADVRYAALSLLATSENEKIILHVQQATQKDSDPRIVELGQRLAKLRQQRR